MCCSLTFRNAEVLRFTAISAVYDTVSPPPSSFSLCSNNGHGHWSWSTTTAGSSPFYLIVQNINKNKKTNPFYLVLIFLMLLYTISRFNQHKLYCIIVPNIFGQLKLVQYMNLFDEFFLYYVNNKYIYFFHV